MFRQSDKAFQFITQSVALSGLILLFGILLFLTLKSSDVLSNVGLEKIITSQSWHPTEGEFNMLPMIVGSVLITALAVTFSLPVGLSVSLFLVLFTFAQRRIFIQRILEVFSGMPSVIYGLWGMVTVVPIITEISGPGTSLLAGAIVLSMMIIPSLIIMYCHTLDEGIDLHYINARSLGMSKLATMFRIIIPVCASGLTRVTILQTARAIGETMAVLMVCGNVVQYPDSLFDPIRTLTTNTALEMAYAMDNHLSALFLSGLILMLIVGVFLFVIKYLERQKHLHE